MKIIITIKSLLNYLYNNIIDLLWTKKIRFEDGTEMTTVPVGNDIYDIKMLSQAIADKGFACMCHTTRQDLSKDDVPTIFNDILNKYNNCDKAELPWTDGVSDPLSYYEWGIDYHNGYVYYINAAYNRIYRSSNITNVNFTQFAQLEGGTNIFPFRCLSKYMVTGYTGGTQIRVISYTDGSVLNIPFNVGNNIVFKEYGDYVYIIGNSNNKIYRIPNVDFSELTTSSIEEVIDCSTYNQGTVTDIHYDSNNAIWYVATFISQSNVAVHKTTDLSDLTKYTFGIWESNQWLEKGNFPRIFQYENRIVVILNGQFNGDWRRIYHTDNGFETVTMIQLSSGFIHNDNYDNAYWSQYGNMIYSTGTYSQKYPGGDFNVICPALETFDITRLIGDSTTFGYSLPYNSAGDGATRFVIDNDNRTIVGWLSKIHYSGIANVKYSDVINGTTIYYYKYNDWKICLAGENGTNDVNLDTVYGYLGYLNYWRLDLTTGSETVSLPRNSNLWTFMFVGDNYQDSNLPMSISDVFQGVATKEEVRNLIPSQSSNTGKFLTTNGSTMSWETVETLPDQTGNSGKFLTTNGTTTSWAEIQSGGSATITFFKSPSWNLDVTGTQLNTGLTLGNAVFVLKNGVGPLEEGVGNDYTISGSTITFTTALVSTDKIAVINGNLDGIDLTPYVKTTELATVATTGNYSDLNNRPKVLNVVQTGTLTRNGAVYSGFSSSDYLQLGNVVDKGFVALENNVKDFTDFYDVQTIEIKGSFICDSQTAKTQEIIAGLSDENGIYIELENDGANVKFHSYIGNGTSGQSSSYGAITYGTKYYFKISITMSNNVATFSTYLNTDGQTYDNTTLLSTNTISSPVISGMTIGTLNWGEGYYFNGSIDISDYSIIKDGEYWWKGVETL